MTPEQNAQATRDAVRVATHEATRRAVVRWMADPSQNLVTLALEETASRLLDVALAVEPRVTALLANPDKGQP